MFIPVEQPERRVREPAFDRSHMIENDQTKGIREPRTLALSQKKRLPSNDSNPELPVKIRRKAPKYVAPSVRARDRAGRATAGRPIGSKSELFEIPQESPVKEKLQSFTFAPIERKVSGLSSRFKKGLINILHRLTNLVPGQRGLSGLAAVAVVLVILVVLVFFGRMMGKTKRDNTITQPTEQLIVAPEPGVSMTGADSVAPPKANLEIDIEVKASSLQIRQFPDQSSALVGTVSRGDRSNTTCRYPRRLGLCEIERRQNRVCLRSLSSA